MSAAAPVLNEDSKGLAEFVRQVNRDGGTYHRIDFGNGLVLEGEYDMREHLSHYQFPESLAGRTALDVGTASGFFALELARRGAEVTAIDIGEGSFQRAVFGGAGTTVRYVHKNLFDLDDRFGRFDLVFCGSLLLHVWDQFAALQRLIRVCRGLVIVATGIMSPDRGCNAFPAAELVGVKAIGGDGEYWTTWMPNGQALTRMMLAAGCSRAEYKGGFRLRSTPGRHNFDTPHGVVHGWV